MPEWSVAPFIGLLAMIAILPLVAPHWWEKNRNKALVASVFGFPTIGFVATRDPHLLSHTGLEYVAFVALLGSLFTISGGIRLRGSLAGTPLGNTAVLAFGALLANLIGTTGASMLLIRPYLRANRRRRSKKHLVVFFIFLVSNIGGCLTPLGDPPLFLGFLQGVPFLWTLRLWAEWATAAGIVLFIFSLVDQQLFFREDLDKKHDLIEDVQPREPLGVEGGVNFLFLGGIIAVSVLSGIFLKDMKLAPLAQAAGMSALAWLSWKFTPHKVRAQNEFVWAPFLEVLILFAGIFAAMIPALEVLKTHGQDMKISQPWHFFWASGALSSVLDNAPTYLAFFNLAQFLPDEIVGTTHRTLAAISCGSVFFGAMTYIGNGPNFMVKAIAEHSGVKTPSFFGYLAWSFAILIPVFVAISLIYFR